ncbi:transporter [Streptomyces sp. N2-109]|uniref:Transporter n=1 Tax=Streptomyces gossypii TaxID=2883101 RepID=A0ABT2JXU3_9ACTN|nr:transporter [Streptomyces gossypii]MCT2592666.1 transporter [Streptomyces gossypii]
MSADTRSVPASGPAGPAGPAEAADAAPARTPHPAPVFVRIKLSLLRNGLHQSTTRTAAFVTSIVLALLVAALQLLGLVLLRGHEHAEDVVLPLTALLALGWAVMPLFFPGGDETLDPTRLVMLPLRPRPLVTALLVASLVGIGPVFTLTLLLGAVIAVAHGWAGAAVAVLALPVALLLCVALARAVATANVRLLTSRKGRDLALLSGLIIAVGAQLFNLGFQKLSEPDGLSLLEPATEVLRWVPPAAAVGAVRAAGDGSYALALAQLALCGVALAGTLWWWRRSMERLMISPDSSTLQAAEPQRAGAGGDGVTGGSTGRASGARGLAALLPAGRTGAVALRSLRYAWRDPKTKVGWGASLGVGILLPVVFAVQGNGSVYNVCWAAGMLGLQMYNQFGQDSSGFWMVASTVSSARDAASELRGRLLAIAVVGVPYVVAVSLLSALLMDDWATLPEVLGLALALLGALLATGVVSSAYFAYSIPQDSGKNVAPGQGSLAYLSIFGGMLVGVVLGAPLLAATIWMHLSGAHDALWLILPAGLAYGAGLCGLALRLMAPRVADRLPEILTAVSRG